MEDAFHTAPGHMKESESELCEICFKYMGRDDGTGTNGGITCDHQHSVCVDCVRQRVTPSQRCSKMCAGLKYKCPVCTAEFCVTN